MKLTIRCGFQLFLILWSTHAGAQVTDNFTDGDFLSNPTWMGDIDSFQVLSGELRNKGNGAGNGRGSLAVSNSVSPNHEWRMQVKFNFNPSSSNFCRFYLTSDQVDLKGNLQGYYVQLGGSTGTSDTVSLYRQNGAVRTRIIAGRPGTIGKPQNALDLKIVRDSTGFWSLYSDTSLSGFFVFEGSVMDSTFDSSAFAGVYCQYTSSNAQGFYFDNFYTGPVITDSQAPVFDSLLVKNANTLELFFSEALDQSSAENELNYIVNGGIGTPSAATLSANKKSVVLIFANNFPLGQTRLISCDGIKDLIGNTGSQQTRSFIFYIPQPKDIVINELFPDPSPQIGLPNAEFIELYNRSGFTFNLNGWQLTDGTSTATLPNIILKPDSFIIICPTVNIADYAGLGPVIGVSSFPSLNNSTDKIVLKSELASVIDEVEYALDWYRDVVKDDGGWSLELINPNSPCTGKNNWSVSFDASGGTPGKQNSVFSVQPDTTAPQVILHEVVNTNTLLLVLSEPIDTISSSGFLVSINGTAALSKQFTASLDSLFVVKDVPFVADSIYQINITGIKDCWGNQLPGSFSFKYLVPAEAISFGVLIDEVYADESPSFGLPDAEYVELYNRMSVAVNLQGWILSDGSSSTTLPKYVLEPDSFVVICSSTKVSLFNSFSNIIGTINFPSLGNEGDELVLKDKHGRIIHVVSYASSWYRNNIKKEGGWSLEMCDVENPCGGASNWKASIAATGGTPGTVNSVKSNNPDVTAPNLLRAYPLNQRQVVLLFNEPLDSLSALVLSGYDSPQLPQPAQVSFPGTGLTKVLLTYNDTFKVKHIYDITADSIRDCSGNLISLNKRKASFGLYELPDSFDIIINEILFNPLTGGSDFVELYNRSNKIINLNDLFIANTDANNSIDDYYRIFTEPVLLFPSEYVALTEDELNVKLNYKIYNSDRILQMGALPGFSDDAGTVVIMDSVGRRYDQFNYQDDYHNPFVDTKDGVSLERIDFSAATQDKNNWTSAAATSGFATPGYRNSQYHQLSEGNSIFQLMSETFSPDGDGYQDQMLLKYKTDYPGYSCTIRIFTSQGYLIKDLLRSEVLGTEGVIKWDGEADNGGKVSTGIYVLYIELLNATGDKKEFRKTVTVATKL